MKRIIAIVLIAVLTVCFAACGKATVKPVDEQDVSTQTETAVVEETETAADAESEVTQTLEFAEFDAKTGTFTISGTEAYTFPRDFDVTKIRSFVIADDVLSADLMPGNHVYTRLEAIRCAPTCNVTLSATDISDSPFYQNSANWTDGVLYVGSSVLAINKDAPKVCVLKSTTASIDWDVKWTIAETAPQVERFEIAEENEYFQTDKSGVLYDRSDDDRMEIVLYPPASPMETYDVPDAVQSLEMNTAKNLRTIHISANSSLSEYTDQVQVPPISAYRVDAGHPFLYSKDGVLFKKGTSDDDTNTVLLDYPAGKSAKEYRIPDGTDEAAYGAFQNCLYLETLYVPASFTEFGYSEGFWSAFDGCTKLAHVYVDKANEQYGSTDDGVLLMRGWQENEDGELVPGTSMVYLPGKTDKHFTIPSGIIAFQAYGNDHIETIELGKDVEQFSIDECPALRSFRAEGNKGGYYTVDGVLYHKWQDWEDPEKENTYLIYYPADRRDKKFTVPDGVTHLYGAIEFSSDSAFHNNTYLEEITLPDSVSFVGIGAFSGCTSLKKVHLPDTLKNLGNGAFHGCTALKEITIPASLEALGYYDGADEYALLGSSITEIEFTGTRAQWNELVHTTEDRPTYLPDGLRVHCADD